MPKSPNVCGKESTWLHSDSSARVATDAERARLWPKFVAFYPGYDFYQRNTKGRKIPVVILDLR